MLQVVETYDAGLILRADAATPLLLVGTAARDCLRASRTSIVTAKPDTPIALLGMPSTDRPKGAPKDLFAWALGRDWYLVDEAETREAYGDTGPIVGIEAPEATIWPTERALAISGREGGAVASAYYEEPED